MKKAKELPQIVLILSSQFMKEHPRAGEQTNFREKILSALNRDEELVATCFQKPPQKLHTIRAKFKEWEAKIAKVNRGEAVLRVVTWSGVSYRSKWVDVCTLTKDDGIGVQELQFDKDDWSWAWVSNTDKADLSPRTLQPSYNRLSKNDGLSVDDFKAWFKGYNLAEPLAIIHFTNFRY
jgi:hypothetical protein